MEKSSDSYILAKYDVSGIQEYIFSSNRLRENAGASFQVTQILEKFLPKAMEEANLYNRKEIVLNWKETDELKLLENENISAEILYIGGGNAIVLFRDKEFFYQVGEHFGIEVAKKVQGIYLGVTYYETNLENFNTDMRELNTQMEKAKRKMVRQPFFSAFPVVEQDNTSHLPITHCIRYGKTVENMTDIQFQKLEAYQNIREYKKIYPEISENINYDYPNDMDQLCNKQEEDSSIAVIHIDGNGMGDRIQKLLQKHNSYAEGVPALRKESKEISKLFNETYAKVLQRLWKLQIGINLDESREEMEIEKKIVPLRPIILDGDDFTIVCRADLAIPFAAGFLTELFQRQKKEETIITACAGIAFVHSHFPFYVAYSLAEESCSHAKEMWYQQKSMIGKIPVMSCLDFQVIKDSQVGLSTQDKKWEKRPYTISPNPKESNPNPLTDLYQTLKNLEDWPSNRLHKIYRACLEGESNLELLKRKFASRGYQLEDLIQEEGEISILFDALELGGLCQVDLLKNFQTIEQEVDK